MSLRQEVGFVCLLESEDQIARPSTLPDGEQLPGPLIYMLVSTPKKAFLTVNLVVYPYLRRTRQITLKVSSFDDFSQTALVLRRCNGKGMESEV
jgi:hypothetical protein